MAYEFDTSVGRLNQRKLYKWLFLLLQKHHERLGLKVLCWSGPDGIGTARLSLFFQRGDEPPSERQLPVFDMHLYQHAISIRQNPSGDALHPPRDQSTVELRTDEMLPWLETNLGIVLRAQQQGTYPLPKSNSAWWSAAAVRYLRSWNVLGLVLKALPRFVTLESIGASSVHAEEGAEASAWLETFYPEVSRIDVLHFRDQESGAPIFWLHSGRLCKASGQSLDLECPQSPGAQASGHRGRSAEVCSKHRWRVVAHASYAQKSGFAWVHEHPRSKAFDSRRRDNG